MEASGPKDRVADHQDERLGVHCDTPQPSSALCSAHLEVLFSFKEGTFALVLGSFLEVTGLRAAGMMVPGPRLVGISSRQTLEHPEAIPSGPLRIHIHTL